MSGQLYTGHGSIHLHAGTFELSNEVPVLWVFSLAVSAFETEFFISGLAPLADQLVTLYFVKESSDHMVTSF